LSVKSPLATAERFHGQNVECALIIDDDSERYGGNAALPVRWARPSYARSGATECGLDFQDGRQYIGRGSPPMNAADIAKGLPKWRKSGDGFVACCLAHQDNNPSLAIRDGDDGRVLVHCHAGCSQDAVVGALRAQGLWPEQERRAGASYDPWRDSRIVAEYDYTDEHGELLYQAVRFDPKDFRPRFPDGRGGWIKKKHPRQVLYHLPEVLCSPIVFIVEGERDVETLRSHGFVATTTAGGCKVPWLPTFTESLRGREVMIIPDNDAPGWKRTAVIARALLGTAAKIRVIDLPRPSCAQSQLSLWLR
jgi:putative DNA primase/helicase